MKERTPVFGVRLESHYVDAILGLPGNTQREKLTKLLNWALINGYGMDAAQPMKKKEDEDLAPQVKALQDHVRTLDEAFNLLNRQHMDLKNLLGY